MIRYLANRLMTMVLTLLAISVIVFAIIQLPPGDYLTSYIAEIQAQGEQVTADKIQFLREEYGLDRPLWQQYLVWVTGLVQGDLGYSFEYSQPVADVVGERMPLTLLLNVATVIFIYLVSFPIGIYSATHQYSWTDHGLSFLGFLGLATPNFLLALILLYFANVWFGTSIGGLMAPEFIDAPWTLAKFGSVLAHLWVPVVVIGTAGTAGMIRRLRANLLDELHRQYVTTARAKGLSERRILFKYPLRMAMNPFIADLGSILPQIVSGSVIISAVMSLPTTGPMLLSSLRSQDMYLAGSFLMFLAVLTVVGMFISDLLLAVLDPRIRLGVKAAR
ncbi:ABC transporter permease [Jiella pelagia]|uniref:ABC transporter permease n=1 Tax=Jiella pelagia TaxID=2986949 RepID=A0ABY7C463_9HYPH|nr:ABC transporter permease [Jiella pelagia]WAP70818.1 ABC transporter permease [Jiella pelagia]